MEQLGSERLPPIFKFSMIWNILLYYGYLHRWRLLLTGISTETHSIWEENKEAFICFGKNWKINRDLNYLNKIDQASRDWLDLISLYLDRGKYAWSRALSNLFFMARNLYNNEVIICDLHEVFNHFRVSIYEEKEVSDIFPAVSCPLFNKAITVLNIEEFEIFAEYFKNISSFKSIVIGKKDEELVVYSAYSSTMLVVRYWYNNVFDIKKLTEEIQNVCDACDWVCRPTRLYAEISNQKESKFVDSLSWTEKINNAEFDISWYLNEWTQIIDDLIRKFDFAKFNFRIHNFCEGYNRFLFSGKWSILLIGDYSFRFRKYNETIKNREACGWDVIRSEDENVFALKVSNLDFKNMILENKLGELKVSNYFYNKISNLAKSSKDVYIFTNVNSLTLNIDLWNINEELKYFEFWTKVNIILKDLLKTEDVLEKIDLLPKNAQYTFEIKYPNNGWLNFLMKDSFIEKIKEIRGRILCLRVEIESKLINKEELSLLIDSIYKQNGIIFH